MKVITENFKILLTLLLIIVIKLPLELGNRKFRSMHCSHIANYFKANCATHANLGNPK